LHTMHSVEVSLGRWEEVGRKGVVAWARRMRVSALWPRHS
jgi:hypothetical protein